MNGRRPPHPELALAAQRCSAGRHDEAINCLARGTRPAMRPAPKQLGLRLLTGDRAPLLPAQGLQFLAEACDEGRGRGRGPRGRHHRAGRQCGRPDWRRALDWLRRAARPAGCLRSSSCWRCAMIGNWPRAPPLPRKWTGSRWRPQWTSPDLAQAPAAQIRSDRSARQCIQRAAAARAVRASSSRWRRASCSRRASMTRCAHRHHGPSQQYAGDIRPERPSRWRMCCCRRAWPRPAEFRRRTWRRPRCCITRRASRSPITSISSIRRPRPTTPARSRATASASSPSWSI